jgi:hypothetical protein
MTTRPNILILGAGSLIAPWLVKRLSQKGFSGQCYSRSQINFELGDNFTWYPLEACLPEGFHPQPLSVVISLLPLWLLPSLLPQLQDCHQLIALSTTSIFSKVDSPDPAERRVIQQILEAEAQIINHCKQHQTPWTILRPTMIYDGRFDANVTAIANFINKWHILPLAKPANGLRQPVHADDLAAVVATAINNPASFQRAFNLGGGETLSYLEMVKKIFDVVGKRPRIIKVPTGILRAICRFSRQDSAVQSRVAMFTRMNQDLEYDWSEAHDTLNYSPRSFNPRFR